MRRPTCGHENREGAKFCDECGKRFHSPQLSAASLVEQTITVFTPEPERKVVTALFSDLTDYTSLTERLDPEQAAQSLHSMTRISEKTPIEAAGLPLGIHGNMRPKGPKSSD